MGGRQAVPSNKSLDSFDFHPTLGDLVSNLSKLASIPVSCIDFVIFS